MWLSPEFVNNLVAVLNVLASQIATALDTLNFALAVDRNSESDPDGPQAATQLKTHGAHHVRSRTPPRTRTRPLDTSSTWYIPELSPPRDVRREVPDAGTEHDPRPGALVDRLPQPMPAPIAANTDRGPVTTSTSTPDSDSDRSVRPHPGASSFRPSPTLVHGPRELLQEFTIALRNTYHEPFTAWTQGELDEMVRRKKRQGRQTHLQDYCPLPPKARGGSKPGRFISNLRHAARHLCSVGAVEIWLCIESDSLSCFPCHAVLSDQVMMEQNVQTFITWTHGVQPTWLQYHGPLLHDHPPGVQAERLMRVPVPPSPPPQLVRRMYLFMFVSNGVLHGPFCSQARHSCR